MLYFETDDAGALFRFTDIYPRMIGGKMWIAMDPPTQDGRRRRASSTSSDFTIRGESALDRVVSSAPNAQRRRNNIEFSQARAEFTRVPGRMTITRRRACAGR